ERVHRDERAAIGRLAASFCGFDRFVQRLFGLRLQRKVDRGLEIVTGLRWYFFGGRSDRFAARIDRHFLLAGNAAQILVVFVLETVLPDDCPLRNAFEVWFS